MHSYNIWEMKEKVTWTVIFKQISTFEKYNYSQRETLLRNRLCFLENWFFILLALLNWHNDLFIRCNLCVSMCVFIFVYVFLFIAILLFLLGEGYYRNCCYYWFLKTNFIKYYQNISEALFLPYYTLELNIHKYHTLLFYIIWKKHYKTVKFAENFISN